jgi:prepilin peptidase CpaA
MNGWDVFVPSGFAASVGVFVDGMRPALLVMLVVAAAWMDVLTRRIPNALVIPGAVVGVAVAALTAGFTGAFSALGGLAIGFALMLPLYLLRAMGAGDVKLMAMVGAWLGPAEVVSAALLVFVAGGLLAVTAALWQGKLRQLVANLRVMLFGSLVNAMSGAGATVIAPARSVGNVPYGIAIAIGTIAEVALARAGWTMVSM